MQVDYSQLPLSQLELRPSTRAVCSPLVDGKHVGDFLDYIIDGQSLYDDFGQDLIGWLGSFCTQGVQIEWAEAYLLRRPPADSFEGALALFTCPLCLDHHCGSAGCEILRTDDSFIWTKFWGSARPEISSRSFRFGAAEYEKTFQAILQGRPYDFSARRLVRPPFWVHIGAMPRPWSDLWSKGPSINSNLTDEQNTEVLESWLAQQPVRAFNGPVLNDLRHLHSSQDKERAAAYTDEILRHSPMDEYQLAILSGWHTNKDDELAIASLLSSAASFGYLPYLRSACLIQAAKIMLKLKRNPEAAALLQQAVDGADEEVSATEVEIARVQFCGCELENYQSLARGMLSQL